MFYKMKEVVLWREKVDCALLAIVIVAGMLPTTVFAAGPTDSVVNRIADTDTWYSDMTKKLW